MVSRVKFEEVTYRLQPHVAEKYNMGQHGFLKSACMDIIPKGKIHGFEMGMQTCLMYVGHTENLCFYEVNWLKKYYIFDASLRDMTGWVQYLQNEPHVQKKYSIASLTKYCHQNLVKLNKRYRNSYYMDLLRSKSLNEVRRDLSVQLLEPYPHILRSLWPLINHSLMDEKIWQEVQNLTRIGVVHST